MSLPERELPDHSEQYNNSELTLDEWQPSNLVPLERVVPPELGITPDGIARFDRFMYGFGTSEGKIAILLSLLHADPQPLREIHTALSTDLPDDVWRPNRVDIRKSIEKSLLPTGLAERVEDGTKVYYSATEEGENLGKAIAARLLEYAVEQGRSSKDTFGKIGSRSNNRTYIIRPAILYSLLNEASTCADISEAIKITDSVVGNNARTLADLGFIEYESVTTTETQGWVSYRLVGDLSKIVHSPVGNRLRRNITAYFKDNKVGNTKTIAAAIGRKDENDIINMLSGLVNAGILERIQYYGGVKQSHAVITSEGRGFVANILNPILEACSGDIEEQAKLKAVQERVEGDTTIIAHGLEMFSSVSSGINTQSREQTKQEILDYIAVNGPTRYQQIINHFGSRAGLPLRMLFREGTLTTHQDGKAIFYSIPPQADINPPVLEKERTIYSYKLPDKLEPPTSRPSKDYLTDLETVQFWEQLAADLKTIATSPTESIFFRFYRPDDPDWNRSIKERDDYTSGTYHKLVTALGKLDISNPYQFLREYMPANEQLATLVKSTQQLLSARLELSSYGERLKSNLQEFKMVEFWDEIGDDLSQFVPGNNFRSFLVYYTKDNPQAGETAVRKGLAPYSKSRFVAYLFETHHEKLQKIAPINNFPKDIRESQRKTMHAYLFAHAPEYVKILLLEKFPDEFGEIALADLEGPVSNSHIRQARDRRLLFLVDQGKNAIERLQLDTLTQQEHDSLSKLVNYGELAKQKLRDDYEPFIYEIATRYKDRGIEMAELVEVGRNALIQAIEQYDRMHGNRFISHATVYIMGKILNYIS